MNAIPLPKSCRKPAVVAALVALAASAVLFWQFLQRGIVSGRAPILSEQIHHAGGFRYDWRVPSNLRAAPWYRAEVRILEDGKPLPFRVEDPEAVSNQGNGRFGVSPFSVGDAQKESIWFSASDNTDPANNGRIYEFEMHRTGYGFALFSVILLALSIMAILVAAPARNWPCLIERIFKPADARLLLLCCVAVSLVVLTAVTLAQGWSRIRILVPIHLPAARLIHSENQFCYRLPRWITKGVAGNHAVLYENGQPMKRSSSLILQSESGRGTFYCSSDTPVQVCFRTLDDSNAALNGSDYTVKLSVFPSELSPLVEILSAVLLAFIGFPLFVAVTEKCRRMSCPRWLSMLKESLVFTLIALTLLYAAMHYRFRGTNSRNLHLNVNVTLETIDLPLNVTSYFLPATTTISLGSGAIELVDSNLFILDRLGHLFIYDHGNVVSNVLPELPMHWVDFQRHARFPLNEVTLRTHDLCYDKDAGYLYASYETYETGNDSTCFEISRIHPAVRAAAAANRWETVLRSPALYSAEYYSGKGAGGKMAVSDGILYFAVGDYNLDRGTNIVSQDDRSFLGKTYSYDLKTRKLTRVSKGHRVPEGLMIDSKGQLWETEHGERGGDKLNLIQAGANYGWPSSEWGTSYQHYGLDTNRQTLRNDRVDPIYAWVPSIAPTAIVELKNFNTLWNGDFLVGSLKAQSLFRLRMKNNHVIFCEPVWIGHRIRDIIARDGQLVLWTDDGSLMFVSVNEELLRLGQLNKGAAYQEGALLKCTTCHSFAEHDPFTWTPTLFEVYNRPIASTAFANYSTGLKAKTGVWNDANLTSFLLNPAGFAPGTTKPGLNLSPKDVADVVEALKRSCSASDR
jgi:cytochrome c2